MEEIVPDDDRSDNDGRYAEVDWAISDNAPMEEGAKFSEVSFYRASYFGGTDISKIAHPCELVPKWWLAKDVSSRITRSCVDTMEEP